jgi:6-phosphogluconolactonase
VERQLVVVDDVAEEALAIFLAEAPRTVVLTGGSTPETFYRRLAGAEYPWEEAELFFGDERCVPRDDGLSNVRMVEETLISKIAATTYAMDGERCDAEGYERTLRRRFGDALGFDLAMYGLGPDGHTASLFPGSPEVDVADRWVVHVPQAGFEPFVPRLSLTVPALSAARLGLFLVAGPEKREALRRLAKGEDIPAARLAPERLMIVADRAAAP